MFGRIGIWQVVLIVAVFIILFGYKKMPEIGRSLGHSLRNFRKSVSEGEEIDITGLKKNEKKDDAPAAKQ